jgi:hypothetical protein
MDEWCRQHRISVLTCALCQGRCTGIVTPIADPLPEIGKNNFVCKHCDGTQSQRPFTLQDLTYWMRSDARGIAMSERDFRPTATGLTCGSILQISPFASLMRGKSIGDLLNETKDHNLVSVATLPPPPPSAKSLVPRMSDHCMEEFLMMPKSLLLDYPDISQPHPEGTPELDPDACISYEHVMEGLEKKTEKHTCNDSRCVSASEIHTGQTFDVCSSECFQQVANELYYMRCWAVHLSSLLVVNNNMLRQERFCCADRNPRDRKMYVRTLSLQDGKTRSASHPQKEFYVYMENSAWISSWGAYSCDTSDNPHVEFAKAMEHHRTRTDRVLVLWKAMGYEQRMSFMRQTCSQFILAGMNHMCSFMLHPMLNTMLQTRSVVYDAKRLCSHEYIQIDFCVMMHYIASSADINFFRDPAVLRINATMLREFYDGYTHSHNQTNTRGALFYTQLLLSWTYYRGVICRMLYEALRVVSADMEARSQRAIEEILQQPPVTPSPSPPPSSNKKKNKNKKKKALNNKKKQEEEEEEEEKETSPSPEEEAVIVPLWSDNGWIDTLLDSATRLCVYCKTADYDCVALPCTHLSACRACLEAKGKCGICNQTFTSLQTVVIV